MNKKQRRTLHAGINKLSADEVAAIVRKQFPGVRGPRVDQLAKAVVADAHRKVSPLVPRMQRG
jgi:hypothetical protein